MPFNNNEDVGRSVFQEEWWLDCVCNGQFGTVTAQSGGQTVGWLRYAVQRRFGVRISDMPLLTHSLGPVITRGTGRVSSQMLRRFVITSELLAKLPRFAHFRQVLAPDHSDALAFQAFGCHVRVQYTFISDCGNLEATWSAMRDKTRNLIRRSQERNLVSTGNDPDEFLRFYAANCAQRGHVNRYGDPRVSRLLQLCVQHDQGMAIMAHDHRSGAPTAAIFVVWDDRSMYFLMSTRSPVAADSGAVSLLVWTAMIEAHRRRLKFDVDGVSSAGTYRFLSGFGGDVAQRLIVEKFKWTYHSADKLRALVYGNAERPFN